MLWINVYRFYCFFHLSLFLFSILCNGLKKTGIIIFSLQTLSFSTKQTSMSCIFPLFSPLHPFLFWSDTKLSRTLDHFTWAQYSVHNSNDGTLYHKGLFFFIAQYFLSYWLCDRLEMQSLPSMMGRTCWLPHQGAWSSRLTCNSWGWVAGDLLTRTHTLQDSDSL